MIESPRTTRLDDPLADAFFATKPNAKNRARTPSVHAHRRRALIAPVAAVLAVTGSLLVIAAAMSWTH